MRMSQSWSALGLIAVMAGVTMLTRFLPFWVFPEGKPLPGWLDYLGKVLPCAMMGMLVVYCLKGVELTAPPFGLPEALGVAAVAALHCWKNNTLLSIAGGTAVYMVLVQAVFA